MKCDSVTWESLHWSVLYNNLHLSITRLQSTNSEGLKAFSENQFVWSMVEKLEKAPCYSKHECPLHLPFLLNLQPVLMNTCRSLWHAARLRVLPSIDLSTTRSNQSHQNLIFVWWKCAESQVIVIPACFRSIYKTAVGGGPNQITFNACGINVFGRHWRVIKNPSTEEGALK